MICKHCQQADHAACEGERRHRTYCDCQHKPLPRPATMLRPVSFSEDGGEPLAEAASG